MHTCVSMYHLFGLRKIAVRIYVFFFFLFLCELEVEAGGTHGACVPNLPLTHTSSITLSKRTTARYDFAENTYK